jgi:hypothetical protein
MTDHDPGNGLATEKTDAAAGAVLKAVVYLLIVTSLVAAGLVYLTKGLVKMEVKGDPAPAPLAEPAGRVPPEPRLQTLPFADIESQRAEEHDVLTSYGWADEKAGTVRIPIDEAMRLIAKRGLPVAAATPAASPSAQAGGAKK